MIIKGQQHSTNLEYPIEITRLKTTSALYHRHQYMASSTHSSVNNSDMRRSQMLHIASQLEHVSEVEASLRDFIP